MTPSNEPLNETLLKIYIPIGFMLRKTVGDRHGLSDG